MRTTFKNEIFIYHTKANTDEETLFTKITLHLDPEITRKFWQRSCLGIRIPHSILVHDLLANKTIMLLLKLTM